ncbi:MAG: hypothetical protein AB1651_08515 [Pseudomonadota bacterium]
MPAPKDPGKAEFYVYRLVADGVPFYVGIGRSARASDRVRYIRYLVSREASGKPVKWNVHTRTIFALLRTGCDIQVQYSARDLTRAQALVKERTEIADLLSVGYTLLNIQHNPQRPKTAEQVIEPVLLRARTLAMRSGRAKQGAQADGP